MNTIFFSHITKEMIVTPSVFTSGWVAVPLYFAGMIVLFSTLTFVFRRNLVEQIILFFALNFVIGFLVANTVPVLSIVAVSLGMASALFFVLTAIRGSNA